jgi:hypothetical protein
MANTFTPMGLLPVRRQDGAAWTAAITTYMVASANAHHFFCGDPIVRLSTGYVDVVAIGSIPTQGTLGVFLGAKYLSTSQSRTLWSNQLNGDMAADAEVYVVDDPELVYRIWVGTGSGSTSGGPAVFGDIGENFNWQVGTGNSQNGISGAYLDYASKATTNTLPLTLIGLVTNPPGTNGTDTTTAGNLVEVIFNQQAFKVGTTGV